MITIQFNNMTYNLPPSGMFVSQNEFIATIIKENHTVESIANNVVGCEDIIVTEIDDETSEVISITHYKDYTEFSRAVLLENYIIGYDTTTETDILADVVEVHLRGKNEIELMQDDLYQQRCDIDYIAMETGVEL